MAVILRNLKKAGIEITFDEQLSQQDKTWLASNYFRWSKFNNLYWKKFSEKDWTAVHEYFGVSISETGASEPVSIRPSEWIDEDTVIGDLAKRLFEKFPNRKYIDIDENILTGIKIEREHAKDEPETWRIVYDHLWENPTYYSDPKPANWAEKELEKEQDMNNNSEKPEFWKWTKQQYRDYWIRIYEAWSPEKEVMKSPTSLKWYANRPDGNPTTGWNTKKLALSMLKNEKTAMVAFIKNRNMDWEHKSHIENAMKEGKSIPEKVLSEYPELKNEPFFKETIVVAPDKEKEPQPQPKVNLTKDEILERLREMAQKAKSDLDFVNSTRFLASNFGLDNTSDEFIEVLELKRGDPEYNLQQIKHFYRTQGLSAKKQHKEEVAKSKAEFDVDQIERIALQAIASDKATYETKSGSIRPEFMANYQDFPILRGREIQLSMPNGEKRNAIFAIVELENIIASHNEENFHSEPLYPKNTSGNNINDRNYSGDLSAQKAVMDYARELEPERLITTSRTPSGTPIITKDGFVVSGNNRTMSLKLAAKQYPENYKEYVKYLSEEMEAYGFSRNNRDSKGDEIISDFTAFNSFEHPVLVRIDLDFPEYTTQELAKYNKDTKKSERPIDKAIKLSNILRDNSNCADIIASIVGEYETFTEFYANIAGQKQLAKTLVDCNLLTEQELPAYFSETTFTESGKEFLESLLAALILDREALLATEQPGIKSTRQKLLTALPVLMKNASLPEGSLKQKINDAVILQYSMKGSTFPDFIRQRTMFGITYDRKTVYINRLIDSGKIKFKQAIEGYNDAIIQNQGASLFGEKPSSDEIFNHWIVGRVSETDKKLIEGSDVVSKDEFKLSPEQIAKIQPEWDKMQDFLKENDSKVSLDIISPDYEKMKEIIPHDQWRDNLIKTRSYAIELFTKEELDEMRNKDSMDWGDRDSIIRMIDRKLNEQYLNEKIAKATPNLSKIKDVDEYLNEIRGDDPELDKIFLREAEGLKIFLVDGEVVRKDHIEFVSGGHGYVYDWVPKNEVWIDENQKYKPNDMEATIKHELFEIGKMRDEGLSYDDAHELANAMEKEVRNNEPEVELPPIKTLPKKFARLNRPFNNRQEGDIGEVMGRPNMFVSDILFQGEKINQRIDNMYLEFIKEEPVKEFPKPETIEYYQRGIEAAEKLLKNINFTGDIAGVEKRIETFKAEIAKLQPIQPAPKDDITEVRLQKLMLLRKFISVGQHEALSELMMGEEGEAGWEIIDTLGDIIQTMPHTYQTEKIDSDDKIVYLHYFSGGSDWYIVEKDKLMPQNQAFGYAILGGDTINAEWGYISILELIQNGVELDFYFTPVKFSEVVINKEERKPSKPEVKDIFPEIAALNSIPKKWQNAVDKAYQKNAIPGISTIADDILDIYPYRQLRTFGMYQEEVLQTVGASAKKQKDNMFYVVDQNGSIFLKSGGSGRPSFYDEVKEIWGEKFAEEAKKDGGVIERKEVITEPVSQSEQSISYNISDYTPYTLNRAIEKLLDDHLDNEYFNDKLDFISGYSGYGGLDEEVVKAGAQIDRGSLYEFYTPVNIIEKMWGLAYKHGYNEGSICEPSSGIGEFFNRKFVKSGIDKTAYETNKYSARICQLLYPEVIMNNKYFEQAFIKNNYTVRGNVSPHHDLIIGNPPYGAVAGKYMGMGEATYSHAKNYIDYFIFRGLDLLKKDGLLIYIVGAEVAAGGKLWLDQGDSKCKQAIAEKGKLIDAYRLPEGIFGRTNVVSDIIVMKKR